MALRKAFEIDPTDRVTEGMLLHTYGYEAYWKDFPRLRADVIEAARNPADQTSTHTLIVPFPVPGDQRRPGDRARGRAPLVGVTSSCRPRRRARGDGKAMAGCGWASCRRTCTRTRSGG
jgi:hypothetical protein